MKTNAVYRKLANNKIRLVKCNLSAFQFVIIGFMPSKFVWFDKKKYYRPLFYLASTVPNLTQTHWTISTNPNILQTAEILSQNQFTYYFKHWYGRISVFFYSELLKNKNNFYRWNIEKFNTHKWAAINEKLSIN